MAGSPASDYRKALADAKKLLDKNGELPKPRVDPLKAVDEADKPFDDLSKLVAGLETNIVASQTAVAKVILASKQYGDMIEASDFGLDPKKADDKKTIDAVQKLISPALDALEKHGDNINKVLSDLDKSLTSLSKNFKAI